MADQSDRAIAADAITNLSDAAEPPSSKPDNERV